MKILNVVLHKSSICNVTKFPHIDKKIWVWNENLDVVLRRCSSFLKQVYRFYVVESLVNFLIRALFSLHLLYSTIHFMGKKYSKSIKNRLSIFLVENWFDFSPNFQKSIFAQHYSLGKFLRSLNKHENVSNKYEKILKRTILAPRILKERLSGMNGSSLKKFWTDPTMLFEK